MNGLQTSDGCRKSHIRECVGSVKSALWIILIKHLWSGLRWRWLRVEG